MLTLFWTVFFCLGWRIITDQGQILYCLRKPFDKSQSRVDYLEGLRGLKTLADVSNRSLLKHKFIVLIGKPFITCITCFASVWGISTFVALNGLDETLITPLIFNCFSAAFIQTFIWNLYVRISNQ